ncbi:MAG: RidA family protein [Gemmatimonadaceae bacterium]|nr:RidA family protein [Gemmatimonadaceae bacterium]
MQRLRPPSSSPPRPIRSLSTRISGCALGVACFPAASGLAHAQGDQTIRRINPASLSPANGYTHVVEVSLGRTLYIAGQIALDSTGALVGAGDFAAQSQQVFANLRRALDSAGATFSDVVKLTMLSTDASKLSVVREIRARHLDHAQAPASTFMEVRGLARSEWLIEIEAIAVVRSARCRTVVRALWIPGATVCGSTSTRRLPDTSSPVTAAAETASR